MKEKKDFFTMVKYGIVLALYAAAACVGLAFVYSATSEIIAKQQTESLEAALRELFPQAETFVQVDGISSPSPLVSFGGEESGVYRAVLDGKTLGLALQTSTGGYEGPVKLLVAVSAEEKIIGINILEHSETPGLGANIAKHKFYGQFAGKSVHDQFVVRQDVEAVTAATISSTAVSASVKAAGNAAFLWMSDNNNGGE